MLVCCCCFNLRTRSGTDSGPDASETGHFSAACHSYSCSIFCVMCLTNSCTNIVWHSEKFDGNYLFKLTFQTTFVQDKCWRLIRFAGFSFILLCLCVHPCTLTSLLQDSRDWTEPGIGVSGDRDHWGQPACMPKCQCFFLPRYPSDRVLHSLRDLRKHKASGLLKYWIYCNVFPLGVEFYVYR